MMCPSPVFSESQWAFLSVLEAFGQQVSVDVVAALAPLSAGRLLDLLERTEELAWIQRPTTNTVELTQDLPADVLDTLKQANTPNRVSFLLDRLRKDDLIRGIESAALAGLFARAGQEGEAARLEHDLAQEALASRDADRAMKYLRQATAHHARLLGQGESDRLFVSESLQLSDLCIFTGRNLDEALALLQKARSVADRLGDRRSRALICLHLGIVLFWLDRRFEALETLSSGQTEVEELGDDDILSQSAECLGLSFLIQGRLKEALGQFERALATAESREGRFLNVLARPLGGLCTAWTGRFHEAIGILDSEWRSGEFGIPNGSAVPSRAILAIALLMAKKKREALFHLNGALREATERGNAVALYLARGGLAYHHFLEGRLQEARDTLAQAVKEAGHAGIRVPYQIAFLLEIVFECDRMGYEPVPGLDFQSLVDNVMREPNVQLRGVASRLLAQKEAATGQDSARIQSYLTASEDFLNRSGDEVQLAKTRLEMARLELGKGNREEARGLAQRAWQGLSGYADELFPDDLRPLLENKARGPATESDRSPEVLLERFLEMTEDLIPGPDLEAVLTRTVAATNRLFGAERGGLFWLEHNRPVLRAACHLTKAEVASKSYRSNMALVSKAYRENRPLVIRKKQAAQRLSGHGAQAILCLPLEVGGEMRGVLYHDNSYLDDCFDFIEGPLLPRLTRHLSLLLDRIWNYERLMEERNRLVSTKPGQIDSSDLEEVVASSPIMVELLEQVDQIARSDSIVLLLGETGVGKELLARRIHGVSPRREEPYVVVDVTTIPENLVESELFGHEKGAFTGADKRKIGRLELAHKGTLLLDEVGELPLSLQSKLLRALEQKTFVRVGGTRMLSSDFRLIAATNRDLADEVAAGRFREDLYYRLNVVPLTIPPLRERADDVVLLAHRFLGEYGKRFGRDKLALTPSDETSLKNYDWPGNVRELRNVMERAILLSSGGSVELNFQAKSRNTTSHFIEDNPTMDELQRRYIRHVLKKTGGQVTRASQMLGMNRTTLLTRMKKLGVSAQDFRSRG